MGSDDTEKDPNLLIDKRNPTSKEVIISIITLSELLGRKVRLGYPRARYNCGWRPKGADPSDIIAPWELYYKDMDYKLVELTFDVPNDDIPVGMGMDIKHSKLRIT